MSLEGLMAEGAITEGVYQDVLKNYTPIT